jgi:hypothetical protein
MISIALRVWYEIHLMSTTAALWLRRITLGSFLAYLPGVTPASAADVLDRWTTIVASTNYCGLRYVAYGNNQYVACGFGWSDRGVIFSSQDGKDWVTRMRGDEMTDATKLGFCYGLSFAGGKFFALSEWNASAVSANGTNWTLINGWWWHARGVAFGAGTYVSAGGNYPDPGLIYSSPDGVSWAQRQPPTPSGANLADIAFGAGLFVAIGSPTGSVDDQRHYYVSSDGISWTRKSFPTITVWDPYPKHIAFCQDRFFVSPVAGTSFVSRNGTNWATLFTGLADKLEKVEFANGIFLARAGTSLVSSTDGTNWYRYASALPGEGLATDGIRLVTVDDRYTYEHYDGLVYYSDPLAGVRITNSQPPQVIVSGLVGRSYQIQSTDALSNSGLVDWQTRATFQLPGYLYFWTDPVFSGSSQRFYRTVVVPPPPDP